MTHSLRRRLLAFLLAAIALFALAQGIGAYRGALRQADAMFDFHLQQTARSLRGGVLPPGLDFDDDDVLVQIWGPDGVQLFRSPRSLLPPSGMLGFSDVTVGDRSYRVYTMQTPLQTVQIAQDVSARNARARALAVRAVLPVTLMAPLLMLVVWWVVSSSLRPVERMRRQVAARRAEELDPLPVTGLPQEVRPLVDELNGLFARVRQAFDAQQHFVADAAHELRSPLTALKLQAQALARADERQDEGARQAAVARLNQGVERAIRLVEQLLALAREEAGAAGGVAAPERLDLRALARAVLAERLPQAAAAGIDLGLDEGGEAAPALTVLGHAPGLRVLVGNLLDNALKYTPAPGRVDLRLAAEGAEAVLTVDDSGPGIGEPERARVFDRFYRGAGAGGPGSGLGLAIVKAIAERHRAVLRLDRAPVLGGLRVEFRLPLAAPPSTA